MTSASPLTGKALALLSPIVQDRIGRCAAGGREMALKGQAAIVTVAGQGIGKAIATRLCSPIRASAPLVEGLRPGQGPGQPPIALPSRRSIWRQESAPRI